MESDQEAKLAEMGYEIRNTFLEPLASAGEELNQRPKSDPTSSSSSSRESSTQAAQRRISQLKEIKSRLFPEAGETQEAQPEGPAERPAEGAAERAQDVEFPVVEGTDALRLRAAAKGLDLDDVLVRVPLDREGRLTSMGSIRHSEEESRCRPCVFFVATGRAAASAATCSEGILCRYCHFQHDSMPKIRLRPCKSRRNRLNKLMTRLVQEADDGPETETQDFRVEDQDIPDWVKRKPLMLEKLKTSVRDRVVTSKHSRVDGQEQVDALDEAPSPNRTDGFASSSPSGSASLFRAAIPGGGGAFPYFDPATGASVFRISL